MLDNVQVAGPPGGLSAWRRTRPWWDSYFAVVLVGTIVFSYHPGSSALLVVMAIWYVAFGRAAVWAAETTWRDWVYLAGLWLLFIPAVALSGGAAFILFALAPQAHMGLDFRPAVAVSAVLNLTPAAVQWVETGNPFPDLPIGLMAVVMTAVIGLTIVRLIAQGNALAQSRAEVARLSQEAERRRLAGDLHDTIAQGLSSVVMLVQAADAALDRDRDQARRHLELAARTARENLQELRAVLDALMPSEHDLPEALQRLASRFTEETSVPARVEIDGEPRPLPLATEVVLLRAAQESLSNVRQHAAASRVSVALSFAGESVRLEVRDDGHGFSSEKPVSGYGLEAMRSRVTSAGGSVSVQPTPNGTTVLVAVPA